jgi:hypothetical protein
MLYKSAVNGVEREGEGKEGGGREGGCEQRVKKEGVVGSEGGEGVREGEGVVGRTYCIQLKNNDIIVVVDDLRRTDATLLTGTQPDAHWQLVRVVKRQCNRCRR